ncbi:MAG TPA: metabolite traffic protein EboE [Bacteroidia bacterium]|jgi:hypothetical protein
MLTSHGHLSYCTNIHPGGNWQDHFEEIQKAVPVIKSKISPAAPFGIGLRLSNTACEELLQADNLNQFKTWLHDTNCYVFTINGFPFGDFHLKAVKENVHVPDWTTPERLNYTIRLFDILKELLPEDLEGSISTSPLSYRHWFTTESETISVFNKCTANILETVLHLIKIHQDTGKIVHLNIEPEPDGLIENTAEFIQWYNSYYIPAGLKALEERSWIIGDRKEILQRHLRLCFDVCHSALAYEEIQNVSDELKKNNVLIGKVQLSSALQINLTDKRFEKIAELGKYDEPLYLHQVVARDKQNKLHKFKDLSQALEQLTDERFEECRIHFHVPVFSQHYNTLSSTQSSIVQTISAHNRQTISDHWEIETYTWNVLPEAFQLPINESITREIEWVLSKMNSTQF